MSLKWCLFVAVALCAASTHALTGVPTSMYCFTCRHVLAPMSLRSVRTYDELLDFVVERYTACIARQGAIIEVCEQKYLGAADFLATTSKRTLGLHEYVCKTLVGCFGEDVSEEEMQEVEDTFANGTPGQRCHLCLDFFGYLYRSVAVDDLDKALRRWSTHLCDAVQRQQRYECYTEAKFRIDRIMSLDPYPPCEAAGFCPHQAL